MWGRIVSFIEHGWNICDDGVIVVVVVAVAVVVVVLPYLRVSCLWSRMKPCAWGSSQCNHRKYVLSPTLVRMFTDMCTGSWRNIFCYFCLEMLTRDILSVHTTWSSSSHSHSCWYHLHISRLLQLLRLCISGVFFPSQICFSAATVVHFCLEVRCQVLCIGGSVRTRCFKSTVTWLSWLVLGGCRICLLHLFLSGVSSACVIYSVACLTTGP